MAVLDRNKWPLSLGISGRFQRNAHRVESIADELLLKHTGVPLYVTQREIMDRIAGFPMHRGILAMGQRPNIENPASLLPPPDQNCLVVVCCGISNHDNVGSIFRNAAAFGADAVLLDKTSCDPLYRKSLRVSVGAGLKVPFARFGTIRDIVEVLKENSIEAFSLSPTGSGRLEEVSRSKRTAILLGSEGEGLPPAILKATTSVRIAMEPGFDSLNVAAASAIALHHLGKNKI